MKGVKIPVGESKTIEVDLFSDGATSGPWTVAAIDSSRRARAGATLDLKWDRTTGLNGEKLHLTVTVTEAPRSSRARIRSSSVELGSTRPRWPGLIVDQ